MGRKPCVPGPQIINLILFLYTCIVYYYLDYESFITNYFGSNASWDSR